MHQPQLEIELFSQTSILDNFSFSERIRAQSVFDQYIRSNQGWLLYKS